MNKTERHAKQFTKVLDGRKHPIRGLWIRNGRYYAQVAVERADAVGKKVRRVPLMDEQSEPVGSRAEAEKALSRLKNRRDDGQLQLSIGRIPTFAKYVADYLEHIAAGDGTKVKSTVAKEKGTLKFWTGFLKDIPIDKIRPAHISAFLRKRLTGELPNPKRPGKNLPAVGKRTAELDVIILRNVLKRARDVDQHLRLVPIPPGLNAELKSVPPKRGLISAAELERLFAAPFEKKKNAAGELVPLTKNALEFVDYLRVLAYSGARRDEALQLKWDDVDFDRGQLIIGAGFVTKNKQARPVDFNDRLEAHLKEMRERRQPDSQWMFPSPQRGKADKHVKTFRESMDLVRTRAGLPGVGFHDLRHYFISWAVMNGIDYMTIAKWVGHQDGGILIGKVYGHLADDHAKTQARRLRFAPVVLPRNEDDSTEGSSILIT